eukprot:gene12090-14009_t
MNSYEMTWKRNVGMMKWRKATGQVFSPELDAHFEGMCNQVAEAERRRELKMKIWGAINFVTCGLVELPTDESPLQLHEEMKDEIYRKNEEGYMQYLRNQSDPNHRELHCGASVRDELKDNSAAQEQLLRYRGNYR